MTRTNADALFGDGLSLEEAVRQFRREFVVAALRRHDGNQGKAAEAVGVHRNTMVRALAELEIDARKFKPRRVAVRYRQLTQAEEDDICSYLKAHRWSGAKSAIARKYGVAPSTVTRLAARRSAQLRMDDRRVGHAGRAGDVEVSAAVNAVEAIAADGHGFGGPDVGVAQRARLAGGSFGLNAKVIGASHLGHAPQSTPFLRFTGVERRRAQ